MNNFAVKITYDGTDYCGWQLQPNGISIEEKLVSAIKSVTGDTVNVYGSGRTDSGVHALAQVANFKCDFAHGENKLVAALNANLPDSIRITKAAVMPDDFNARFCAVAKTYVYCIFNSSIFSPFYLNRAYHYKFPLDLDKMNEACDILKGQHDFSAFMASGSSVKTTVRTLYELKAEKCGDMLTITASANGFLYNMVRILAGTLLYAGNGKMSLNDIKTVLDSRLRANGGAPTLPARGLYLKEVYYPKEYEDVWEKA